MNKLTVSFKNTYAKQGGQRVYVYTVDGSKEALEAYATAQGSFFKKDEATGKGLWFTTKPVKDGSELMISQGGKVVTATDLDKEVAKEEFISTEVEVRRRLENIKAKNQQVTA